MHYDVIVIGGGLAGLTAASLLAKRGVRVAVIDKSSSPGGSCGIFKRNGVTYDQGAAMLFGFGEQGFNAHRFVFNCLEEPIDVIQHDLLYCVNYKGHRIKFCPDIDKFAEELALVFPAERNNIKRFYDDLATIHRHIMIENPNYTTPDETDPKEALKSMLRHPVSYARFLGYLNKSAKTLLEKYFSDPEIFKFFDKLTSTYCYTTVEESPAILAAIMFVENHIGGSYYPAGSTLFLPGKLEKVIEENSGEMLYGKEVVKLLFEGERPVGVELQGGEKLEADNLIYSGTVWNLYGKLIDKEHAKPGKAAWAAKQVPTYPSVVLYTLVDRLVIPEDTAAIEMLVGNPDRLDENEVTAYILSIDDRTLCPEDSHVVIAIGPTFEAWAAEDAAGYAKQKRKEQARLTAVLEKRFPGFAEGVRYAEVATPRTLERYLMKDGGAVAGPKQMLGQHMFHRLHTRSEWDNLYCCGESTVMGTGTPTVTTTGLSAANAVLKKLGLEPFVHQEGRANQVRLVPKPFGAENLYDGFPEDEKAIMLKASRCQFCEVPSCAMNKQMDIPGIMRRVTVGNFTGAKKIAQGLLSGEEGEKTSFAASEAHCILNRQNEAPVEIQQVIDSILKK